MKRWIIVFLTLSVLCLISIYVLYPTDERRIIRIINNSEDAIVEKNIDKLMEYVSYNYRDDYGASYIQIKKILQTLLSRLNDIKIERNITKISLRENFAEAELDVRVIALEGENRGYIIGDAGQAAAIKIFFEKSSYKWLITKVEGVFETSRSAF
ncbi:MAG: hypothetical protein HY753_00635 [Nitrospirae bacterium]|nr:hypothetical protein [Nitrospirota bacterium]